MQLGTHLDALSHLQIGDRGYNGWTVAELAGTAGVKRLGRRDRPADRHPRLARRRARRAGARASGSTDLAASIRRRATRCCSTPAGGRTGATPSTISSGSPGPGCELAAWLAERGVALTGCDTWSYGPVPPEDPERPFEVPQILNVRARRLHRREPRHLASSPPPACASSPDPDPSQAARRHRRLDVPDRPRLRRTRNGLRALRRDHHRHRRGRRHARPQAGAVRQADPAARARRLPAARAGELGQPGGLRQGALPPDEEWIDDQDGEASSPTPSTSSAATPSSTARSCSGCASATSAR